MYSIGEISEITDTSGKTLRYYDQIGLLKPDCKNPETLYRYYTKDQVFSVFLIKKLLKWVEAQGPKLGGKICEEYIISPVDINTSSGYVTKVITPLAP